MVKFQFEVSEIERNKMLTLSETAHKEIKQIMENQELKGGFLRMGVKGGGCSGFNYLLDITSEKDDEDEMFEQDGITIICDSKSYLYLKGITVDFRDEVMGRGFVFNNPNATSTCGCGSSFGA